MATIDRSAFGSRRRAPPGIADRRRRLPALPNGGGDHRRHSGGAEGPHADLSRAGPDVPRPHRGIRQEGASPERDRRHQRRRAQDRRLPRREIRPDRPNGTAALRADHREGQLRHGGHADLGRVARPEGFHSPAGRLPGPQAAGGGRHHAGEDQHGGVRLRPVRDGRLSAARLHAEPLRARARHRGLERRNGGVGGGELRRRWAGYRHRKLHPRAGVPHEPRRHPLDDGAHQSRRDRPALSRQGRRRAHGAHGRGCRGRLRRDRRVRSRRSGHGVEPGQAAGQLHEVPRQGRPAGRAAWRRPSTLHAAEHRS